MFRTYRFPSRWAGALAALLLCVGTACSYPFASLLRGTSKDANVIFLINVRAVQRSPLGVSRNWAELRRRDYLGGLIDLPPTVTRVAVALHLDTSTLQPTWRAAQVELSEPMTPAQVQKRESGTEDRVSGVPVVFSRRGRSIVFLSNTLVAEIDSLNRQDIARYIAAYKESPRPHLSPYLEESAESSGAGGQATVAVDLSEVLDFEGVYSRLKRAKALADKRVDLLQLAKTVVSLRGVRLSLGVDRQIDGEIRLDFTESAEPLRSVGKDLLLHAMQNMGASLDDLESWQGSVEGSSFILRGQLTERGARMLLSPAAGRTSRGPYADTRSGGSTIDAPPPNPEAIPSQKYYRSLTALLSELNNEKKPRNISQRGFWYEQYATKIDGLPILEVDSELQELGASVSTTLRGMANLGKSIQGQNKRITQNMVSVAVNVPTTYGMSGYAYGPYRGGGYGYGYTVNKQYEVSNWRTVQNLCYQNAATEEAYRDQTWKNINDAIQTARKNMVAKYHVEF